LIWAALAAKPGTVATLGLRAAVGWEMTVSRICQLCKNQTLGLQQPSGEGLRRSTPTATDRLDEPVNFAKQRTKP
jgi:hypothetical protein